MNDEMNEQNSTEPEVEITVDEQNPAEPETEVTVDKQKKNIDIGGWLKYGWKLFITDVLKFMVAMLIVGVVSIVTCLILSGPMMVGFYKCILKKTRGEDFEYGDLFDGVKTQFLPSFVLMIVVTVCVIIIAAILAIIPVIGQLAGTVISIAFSLFVSYMYLQLAEREETLEVAKLIDLAKATLNKVKCDYGMFLVWALVVYILGFVGVIICCVGALATYSISLIAVTKSYNDIFKSEDDVTVVAEEIAVEE